jgi:5-formyltetrahydrofolate cyclo-ligase
MLSKTELRRNVRAIRDAIDPKSRAASSRQIQQQLLGLKEIRGMHPWFVYVSTQSEVETHDLIRTLLDRDDIVTVPRVAGSEKMIAQLIQSFDELRLDEFGILSAPPGDPYRGYVELCICPGIAFTQRGVRLGSGRGFYDRYLATDPPELAIGLAFESQIVSELPQEIHDRRMDLIITEKRVIHVK